MRNLINGALILGIAASWLGACGSDSKSPDAAAGGTTYNVTLTKGAEMTPCADAGANATGTATVTLSGDGKTITVTNVTYSGLSGDATASHIHANVAGQNGPVVLAFSAPLTSPFSKTFTSADYTAAAGAPASFDAFVTSLKTGGAYINIHTAKCAGGEIRGQIQ
jgi:CHRD domain